MSQLMMPDYLGAFNQGMDRGRQRGLSSLMGQAFNAPADQRQNVLAKLAGVDGAAAMQTQQALSQADDDVHVQLAKRAKMVVQLAKAGQQQMAQQAYTAMLPIASRIGVNAPPTLDQSFMPGLEQLASAMDAQSVPSGYREFELMTNAAGADDSARKEAARIALGLDPRKSSAGYSFEMIAGPDGRERPARRNPRDGSIEVYSEQGWVPLGGQAGPQASPQAAQGGISIDPAMFRGLDPSSQQTLLQQILADSQGQPLTPQGGNASSLAIGRAPEQEAAAKKQAELAAQLAADRARAGFDVDQAAAIERAKGQGKSAADAEATARTNSVALAAYEQAMGELDTRMAATMTGPGVGSLPAVTANQQIAEGTVAAMAPILKSLFRTSGEGVFTDKDQELLMAMIPTRVDHAETRQAKIANINAIVRAKLGGGSPPQAPSSSGGLTPEEERELQELRARLGKR